MTQGNPETPEIIEQSPSRPRWLGWLIFSFIVIFPIVGLGILALIGFQQTPVGEPSHCVATLLDDVQIRLDIEPFEAANRYFERHTFSRIEADGTLTEILSNARPNPISVDCDTNILQPTADHIVVWNGMAVGWSSDNAQTWDIWEVCDAPRPSFGCVDREYISDVTVSGANMITIRVFAPEGNYQLSTVSGGVSWDFGMLSGGE